MNQKLHDLMASLYVKVSHKSDLSKARFTKLVYLSDWKMSQRYGRTISNIKWLFNHYGPYVDDVVKLARDSADFNLITTRNAYGSIKEKIEFTGSGLIEGGLDPQELEVIDEVVRETDPLYFNDFINLVYDTYPVRESSKYSILDLPKLAQKESLANGEL